MSHAHAHAAWAHTACTRPCCIRALNACALPACLLFTRVFAALQQHNAGALALGYANIFVTAPSPENLCTLFEFVFKGLDGCGYQVRAAPRALRCRARIAARIAVL